MKEKVALILPYDKTGKILFQDRRKISKKGEEYGFFGGHLEKKESPEQALKREIKEELNLEAENLNIEFFKNFIFDIPQESILVELSVFLVQLENLEKIKSEEGKTMVLPFKKVFELNLPKEDRKILEEIYNHLNKN